MAYFIGNGGISQFDSIRTVLTEELSLRYTKDKDHDVWEAVDMNEIRILLYVLSFGEKAALVKLFMVRKVPALPFHKKK